jgi:uncharacterized protein (TIGR03083 family)
VTSSRLPPQRYFETLDADTERILEIGGRAPDAPVPACPGWVVDDLLRHVAEVYEHKVRVIADNAWPDPWPPADPPAGRSVDRLAEAKAALFGEFADHEIDDEATTFAADDQTIGFWVRRMALEAAVHRVDAEQAVDDATTVPADLAADGVDEVLRIFLGGPWWADRVVTRHPVDATVAVVAGDRAWGCTADRHRVGITEGVDAGAADAVVRGEPSDVLLWLWGRADDTVVTFDGDAAVLREFRGRLSECTG